MRYKYWPTLQVVCFCWISSAFLQQAISAKFPQSSRQSSLSSSSSSHNRGHLPVVENISVILVQWFPPAVRVQWNFDLDLVRTKLRTLQLVYHPVHLRYRIIQELPVTLTNFTLFPLQPGIEYKLHMNTVAETGEINATRPIHFISPSEDRRQGRFTYLGTDLSWDPTDKSQTATGNVRADEIVIVVLVLTAWIGIIFIFFNKWGKIRMLEPYQPQYQAQYETSLHSIHPKPSRMNTCTSTTVPHMQSTESRQSLGPDRDVLMHHHRLSSSGHLYQCASGTTYHHPAYRPRLNSVFVGSPFHRNSLCPEVISAMPRKVKSAEDLKSLVVQVTHHKPPSTSTTAI